MSGERLLIVVALSLLASNCGNGDAEPAVDVLSEAEVRAVKPYPLDWAQLTSPPAEFRPWVRWWWPGNDVETSELQREVGWLADNGFGGAEIQAFDAALDPGVGDEELVRRLSFDTESYYANVRTALDAAGAAGLRIDLTLGSGWPTGGLHVPAEESLQTLMFAEDVVQGPSEGEIVLDGPDMPPFYQVAEMAEGMGEPMARYLGDQARLVAVVAAREVGGERHDNPLILTDVVELLPGSSLDLTDQVDSAGKLTWDVPAGKWRVVSFFAAPDGEYVNLAAQAEKGFAVDHFHAGRIEANMEHLLGAGTGLPEYYGQALRAFFVDSFELKTERHFSDDLLVEFEKRRGYDVVPLLPAAMLPGADNSIFDGAGISRTTPFFFSADDERILYDYALTVSDLFIERFVEGSSHWASQRALQLRIQPYGINVDVIRAAGSAHLPEAEQLYGGGSEMLLKAISSGAHLYGRNIVSAESLVWSGRDHMTTPQKLKAAADKLFAAGINHLVYHGVPYRKVEGYGETGWHAFSSPFSGLGTFSSHVGETSPLAPHLEQINRYVSRCQYLLRLGEPTAELLVYYPFLGFTAALTRLQSHEEFLFKGALWDFEPIVGTDALFALVDAVFGDMDLGPVGTWLSKHWEGLQALSAAGHTWEWVNPHSLATARAVSGEIEIRGNHYRGVLLLDVPHMPVDAASALAQLAADGVPVVSLRSLPSAQPGYHERETGDEAVAGAMQAVLSGQSHRGVDSMDGLCAALVGAGFQPAVLLTDVSLDGDGASHPREGERGARTCGPGGRVRRASRQVSPNSVLHFLTNLSAARFEGLLSLPSGCLQPLWYDAWTGDVNVAAEGAALHLSLALAPLESRFLLCGFESPENAGPLPSDLHNDNVDPSSLTGWTLTVAGEDVGGGEAVVALDELIDWRELPDLAHCSSTGQYATTFQLPAPATGKRLIVEAAWVHGAATLSVNGKKACDLLVSPFVCDVTDLLQDGDNDVTVNLVPSLRNRLVGLGLTGDPEAAQFAGKNDTLTPVGLVGPVRLRYIP